MKTRLLIALFLFIASSSRGQAPHWAELTLLAGQSFDYGNAVKVDGKGNYYVTASSLNPVSSFTKEAQPAICNFVQPADGSISNGALLRYDAARNLTLAITVENASMGGLAVDRHGNMYVTGVYQYGARRDGFLRKYSPAGKLMWDRLVSSADAGGSADNVISSLDLREDGSMVLCGFSYGSRVSLLGQTVAGPVSFITKLAPDGSVAWTNSFTADLGLGAAKVRFDREGDVLLAGNKKALDSNGLQAVIAKLGGDKGELVWEKRFPSSGNYVPTGTGIGVGHEFYTFGGTFGGELTIGDTTLVSTGGLDIFLLQCDASGNIRWVRQAGSTGRETLSDMLTDANGVTLLTGGFSDGFQMGGRPYASKGNTDVYVGAIDSGGEALWVQTGGSGIEGHKDDLFYDERGASLAVDSRQRVHVVGTTVGTGSFGGLAYRASEEAKLNAFWATLGGEASAYTLRYPCDNSSVLDTAFTVEVFPNPFTEELVVSNSAGTAVDYHLTLYSGLGQMLESRAIPSAATATVEGWGNLAAGLYLLRVRAGAFSRTFKLIKK